MITHQYGQAAQRFFIRFLWVFILLFIITLTEYTDYLPSLRSWTNPLAEQLVLWSGQYIWHLPKGYIYQLSSDSMGSLIHLFNLILIACLGSVIWGCCFPKQDYNKLLFGLTVMVRYYLALQLLLYGFNKVFKCQFFIPEPNILYTTVGETPRDLLFWSLMGSAYGYTVFGGLLEVIAACLLLFRKTYLLGALMAFGLLANVVAINFGFNISVKMYSSIYCFLSIILILPHLPRLYAFFIQNQLKAPIWQPNWSTSKQQRVYLLSKIIVIWLLFFEGLGPYFATNNFNDDTQERPLFHGAYAVGSFVQNDYSIPPLQTYHHRWKRAFVHRRGYFIVQTMDDKMQDYEFYYDNEQHLFELIHPHTQISTYFEYQQLNPTTLLLTGTLDKQVVQITLQALDWKKLPLLKDEIHWTIDQIRNST